MASQMELGGCKVGLGGHLPYLWWVLRRGGSSGMSQTRVLAGPGAAGAAEVHSNRGLLELWHPGLRVHHRLPAFPPQLAAGAVVSGDGPKPGWPPEGRRESLPLSRHFILSRVTGWSQARPETSVICLPASWAGGAPKPRKAEQL